MDSLDQAEGGHSETFCGAIEIKHAANLPNCSSGN